MVPCRRIISSAGIHRTICPAKGACIRVCSSTTRHGQNDVAITFKTRNRIHRGPNCVALPTQGPALVSSHFWLIIIQWLADGAGWEVDTWAPLSQGCFRDGPQLLSCSRRLGPYRGWATKERRALECTKGPVTCAKLELGADCSPWFIMISAQPLGDRDDPDLVIAGRVDELHSGGTSEACCDWELCCEAKQN